MCMPEYTDKIYSSSIISTYNKWTYQSRVAINNDLSWDIRIKNVINTVINTFLYLLSRVKVFLSFQNRKRFYNAYILPNFGAAKAILDVEFTVPSETMFTHLKWMTSPDRVVYRKAIQMYKTVFGNAPDYLKMILFLHPRLIQEY